MRNCSSMETPFLAASWRSLSFTGASRFLTVMLAK